MRALLRRILGDFVTRDAGTRQGFEWRVWPRDADGQWRWTVVQGQRTVAVGLATDRSSARTSVDNVIWREVQL